MANEYVEVREGSYYLAGSRGSLASIVYAFRGGASPETIRENFPSLSLAQVYGGIACLPKNRDPPFACGRRSEQGYRRGCDSPECADDGTA
jgi:uncharacterized protein (DUF433 family)